MTDNSLEEFKTGFESELFDNILPYWFRLKTDTGFTSALDNANKPISGTPLGLIMVSRLLWTYSRAYDLYKNPIHRELGDHAKKLLLEKFADKENGGFYWTLDDNGAPLETKKQCYGQAFCVYAFSEHFIATGDQDSLDRANTLFSLIEEKAWDPKSGGYLETFQPDWTPLEKMRLGEDDLDAPKTMNNHLHLIEAWVNLLRAERSETVKSSCRRMLRVIADRIILPNTPRFGLFYNMDWELLDPVVSPGHDIEGSWLLWEAAEIIGDEDLETEFRKLAIEMANLVIETGLDENSAVNYEFHEGHAPDTDKHWWPQAEAVVGFYNAYELTGDTRYLKLAKTIWKFIQDNIVDKENGEWFWGVKKDGTPMNKEKAGPWKSSYHNGRTCFEMISRIGKLLEA